MRSGLLLIASCAALALSAPALAADYDPPIYIEEAPEFVPVEIGSGWYLRGDIGYDVGKQIYDFVLLDHGIDDARLSGGIGVGYHFSDNFRTDITLSYLGEDSIRFSEGPDYADASHAMWSGLVNGYYDIATVMGLTPYVGAGLGFTYSRHKVDIDVASSPPAHHWNDSSYNFAYALMAGASYKVTDNLSVDAGYQFLHTPDLKYVDADTREFRKGVKQHHVKVGLRYDLW